MESTTSTSTSIMPSLVGLCHEIRRIRLTAEGNHHWAIGNEQFQMQTITCAICGNYQLVSYDLSYVPRVALCQDRNHIIHMMHMIAEEERIYIRQ
jgi:hypothetical protein